jgi:peroxiredoxin
MTIRPLRATGDRFIPSEGNHTPQRGAPLSTAQMLLLVLSAVGVAAVGYFEFMARGLGYFEFEVGAPHRRLKFTDSFSDRATLIEALLEGLMQAVPVVLLAAVVCATYALLQHDRPQRRRGLWLACCLFLIFIAGIAVHQTLLYQGLISAIDRGRFEQAQAVGTRTSLGDAAPDITVPSVEGTTVRLADLRGRVVLLTFFATSSPPCGLALPELQKLWNEFHSHEAFRMLAIGRGESIAGLQAFAAEHGFTFPLAADADRSAFNLFATEGIPRLYLISREGKIIFQCQGYHQEELATLTALLKPALAGRE